ncbi:MAG: hypothetical protein ACYTFK_01995 [Planctomycetota bacterium]
MRTICMFAIIGLQPACLAGDVVGTPEQYIQAKKVKAAQDFVTTIATDEGQIVMNSLTTKFGPSRADQSVLVVPAGDMDPQRLAQTTEDMNIMSRIFENDLAEADMLKGRRTWFGILQTQGPPQNIYLEGYGALFLMEVDFPLLPLPQADEKETEDKEVDQVWQDAKREVYQPTDGLYFKIESDEEQEPYDATKVEELKARLIKNFKHAANIRNLKSTEWIVVAVTGSGRQSSGVQIRMGAGSGSSDDKRSDMLGRTSRGGSVGTGRRGGSSRRGRVGFGGGFMPGLAKSASVTVLTVKAKKSDVDAFVRGELDLEKFQKRVLMYAY